MNLLMGIHAAEKRMQQLLNHCNSILSGNYIPSFNKEWLWINSFDGWEFYKKSPLIKFLSRCSIYWKHSKNLLQCSAIFSIEQLLPLLHIYKRGLLLCQAYCLGHILLPENVSITRQNNVMSNCFVSFLVILIKKSALKEFINLIKNNLCAIKIADKSKV